MEKLRILEELDWDKVDEILIDKFCWDYDFKPLSKAKLCVVKNKGICVKMWSYEDNPVSIHTKNDQEVYRDSCLELFINTLPDESDIYLNFEVNHLGAMLVQFGTSRSDRKFLSELVIKYPKVSTFNGNDMLGAFWGIEYTIPRDIFENIYNKPVLAENQVIRAAFYKCGDKTGRMHFGSWQHISTETPDFHRPEYFGKLIICE